MTSALTDKAFWLIVVAVVLGAVGISPWVFVPLLAALLTLFSTISDQHWFDEFSRVGRLNALAMFWLGCLAQNLLFVGAAYVVGAGLRWWWLPALQ